MAPNCSKADTYCRFLRRKTDHRRLSWERCHSKALDKERKTDVSLLQFRCHLHGLKIIHVHRLCIIDFVQLSTCRSALTPPIHPLPHTRTHSHTHTHAPTPTHTHARTQSHTDSLPHTHTRTHSHTHTHTLLSLNNH